MIVRIRVTGRATISNRQKQAAEDEEPEDGRERPEHDQLEQARSSRASVALGQVLAHHEVQVAGPERERGGRRGTEVLRVMNCSRR